MKKQNEAFLMANIQTIYQQKKMLRKEHFEELLKLDDWEALRSYVLQNHSKLPAEKNIARIDQWYADELKKLRLIMFDLNLPEKYIAILFAKQTVFTQLQQTDFQKVDETLLALYVDYLDQNLHPLVNEYAKWRIDEFFISHYLREETCPPEYQNFLKGYLKKSEWDILSQLPLAKGVEWLKKSKYHGLFSREKKWVAFEKQMDNFILQSLKKYRYQTQGLEGIFTYCVEKNAELFNLRLLLKGKYYQLSTHDIQERMRLLNV